MHCKQKALVLLKLDQRVRMGKKKFPLQFGIVGFPQAKPFCQWYVYVVTRPGHLPPDDATDVSLPGISKKFIRKEHQKIMGFQQEIRFFNTTPPPEV